jgi:hypothetical protein
MIENRAMRIQSEREDSKHSMNESKESNEDSKQSDKDS